MTSHRTLVSTLFLFVLISGCIWVLTIFGQSAFPGSSVFPFVARSIILSGVVAFTYYLNHRFCKKNELNASILKLIPIPVKQFVGGSMVAFVSIATIWIIIYLIYPFEIIRNVSSTPRLINDLINYSLGNTLEELLFRGFLLLAAVKLMGKLGGIVFVSLLFGLFHLPGLGLTTQGLMMVITTFTMSLLFIAVIYYTKSIWTAVALHVTGNLLLHTFGFDGANNGLFQIRFSNATLNGYIFTLIYEVVVISLALFVFHKAQKEM